MDDGVSQHEGIYLYAFSFYKPGEKESHQGSLWWVHPRMEGIFPPLSLMWILYYHIDYLYGFGATPSYPIHVSNF